MTLGTNIKRLLNENGINQAKFAELVGVEPGTVSRWVRDQAKPEPERIPTIAKILGITAKELMQGLDIDLDKIIEAKVQSVISGNQSTFTLGEVSISLNDIGDKLRSLKEHHRDAVLELLFHGAENEAQARAHLAHEEPLKQKSNKK